MNELKRRTSMGKILLGACFLMAGALLMGASPLRAEQTQTAKPVAVAANTSGPSLQSRSPRYRVNRGDTFTLSFPFSPEFNQTVTVEPDGYISLKGTKDLHVYGLTLDEMSAAIKQSYTGILRDPEISIEPQDLQKPYFIAAGWVNHPGKYDLRSDLTVSQALALAGWFNEKSKHSQVVLFHKVSPDMYETKLLNVKKMMSSRDINEDVEVQPGDMIYVPQNKISKIMRFVPLPNVGVYASPTNF